MTAVLLIGDALADPLIPALESEFRSDELTTHVVSPSHLADTVIASGARWFEVEGCRIGGVVFRADPALIVAPRYGEEDAGFAAAETRAVWAHILSIPNLVAVNRAHADTWFASSDWLFWRRRLAMRGVPVAPRRVGRPYRGGYWVRWTGGVESVPADDVAERLGAASVAGGFLRRTLCCAAEPLGAAGAMLEHVARILAIEGVFLAEVFTDAHDRLVGLTTLPALSGTDACSVAPRLARWMRAALDR